MARAPAVFTIPPGVPFARALADGVLAHHGRDPLALADALIFVPTRRAARTLHEAFAEALGGAALGPRIAALGDVDPEEIALDPSTDDLALPAAVPPLRRRLLLARLVEAWADANHAPQSFAQAAHNAAELGRFLDEAITQGVDLSRLDTLVEGDLAAHWEQVAGFLAIIGKAWPRQLEEDGLIEGAARRDQILAATAERLKATPPSAPVIAAGSTGSIPATAALLGTIARLPTGAVVLPGLDTGLDEAAWAMLDEGHPQFGLKQLLGHIGIARAAVAPWPGTASAPGARIRFISEALRPPPTTDAWRTLVETRKDDFADSLKGMSLIEADHGGEEALAIAIILRETLETPGRTAALVTPDRGLARRVAAELGRWDSAIDDSAGTRLSRTPPGAFLAILARAVADRFAPVPLLALLKHPLAAGGMDRTHFRRQVRALEIAALRGLRPAPGLEGVAAALARKKDGRALTDWFADLAKHLAPFAALAARDDTTLAAFAEAHATAAEALTASAEETGARVLWRGEAGNAAGALIADLIEQGGDVVPGGARAYAELFGDLAEERVVRPAYGRDPRLAILGPLEARLQTFDRVILGGLNEGTWPAESATDPWLSRPMRKEIGLEAPERRTGLAAHDFSMLAAAPEVFLTRAKKADGAPATASRWVLRLQQLAGGLGIAPSLHTRDDLLVWARRLDKPRREAPARRPAPRPPVAWRPRTLRVTEIETWLRDPYAIYARYVLGLKPLDPLDAEPGPRERGIAVHEALETFLKAHRDATGEDALNALLHAGEAAFAAAGATEEVLALWWPRFARAARWFVNFDAAWRETVRQVIVEAKGEMALAGPAGPFTLRGRADRIDFLNGGGAAILDYKTGRVPSAKQIEKLLAPQLPLEGAMLMAGGFDADAETPESFVHVRLTGAYPPGECHSFDKDAAALAAEARARLIARIAQFDEEATPYPSRYMLERLSDTGDYDHLARVGEWALAAEGEE